MTPQCVDLSEVAGSTEARLDPHHYVLFSGISDLVEGFTDSVALSQIHLGPIRNGVNLPQAAYAVETTSDYLYASVGVLSQFAFQPERCQALADPSRFNYAISLKAECLKAGEVVVTRSGTPGIAWAPTEKALEDASVLPSGFLIRFDPPQGGPLPSYIAAILNHPVWRVWSASLAGGKRQRNLSQEHLAAVRIPRLSVADQEEVAEIYGEALVEIDDVLKSETSVTAVCDLAISDLSGLKVETLRKASFTFSQVQLGACADTTDVRIDARYFRNDVRAALAVIDEGSAVRFSDLFRKDLTKGRQPEFLVEGMTDGGGVIATSSIQGGQVQEDLLKLTSLDAVESAGELQVHAGDLVLAMDGEGSIGKAAVYRRTEPAITDSHIAIIRLADPSLVDAIACFINSSLGQAQIERAISGSTGQTQLHREDVGSLRVPREILDNALVIGERYRKSLAAYEPLTRQVRRRVCGAEAAISEVLLHADMTSVARGQLERIANQPALIEVLGRLKPSMF